MCCQSGETNDEYYMLHRVGTRHSALLYMKLQIMQWENWSIRELWLQLLSKPKLFFSSYTGSS